MIARARGFDLRTILDNILVVQTEDSEKQERIVGDIDSLLKKTEGFKLLVVDSPVTHYRSEYIGRAMLSTRQQKVYRFMHRLLTIARTYNIAVVITNHINTTPDSQEMFARPIGGNVMGHAVTYGVRLSTHLGGLIHYATILHSPYHHQKDAVFYIREKGLEDD
jgi:DNA repair protein RadA